MRKVMVVALLGLLAVTAAVLAAGLVLGPSRTEGAFPGANGKIAFTSDRDGNYEIYVMNADGSGQTNLTNSGASDYGPAWSPDGTQIAFQTDRDGNTEVYVMNADGSGQTNLTNNPAWDGGPAWSPDGTKIAFGSGRDGGGDSEVYVMNADGSGQTRLTNNPASQDGGPAWSPDGSKIAFIRGDRPGPRYMWDIYVMNPDGSGQTILSDTPYSLGPPDWSPDGTKITYYAFESGHDIFVMNADGSSQTNLTNSGASDWGPAWSPDGSKIAFNSNQDSNYEIYVMNPNGSGVTRLTNNSAEDSVPDWQPLVVYSFGGFFRPVDNLPVLNSAKAGSGVPVKFSLGGDEGLDIFATGYPRSQKINCDTSAPLDTIEETVTAGSSSLSYDPIADQYVYVWKTDKAWAGTCRQLMVRLDDLTDHVANFNFK